MLKIHNVRRGFATNSSSSHSIVVLPAKHPVPDEVSDGDGGYGWEDFVLTSPEEKARYARTQARGGAYEDDGYVDHQSVWDAEGFSFRERVTGMLSSSPEGREFMAKFLQQSQVIVLGGNDNQRPEHNLVPDLELAGASILGRDAYVLVNDPRGHCVFFDPASGDKIRVTLGEDSAVPVKGTWPELVDVKITDFCPYGCTYCYQGSTPAGMHAPLELIQRLATKFAASGVLEVALGGGEPTLHPQFREIVHAFSAAGLIVNVTSRNVQFWKQERDALREATEARTHVTEVLDIEDLPAGSRLPVKAVAFSVDSAADVLRVQEALGYSYNSFQVHFQLVVGTTTLAEFDAILEAVGDSRLTLLGYKTTGRGEEAMFKGGLPLLEEMPDQTEWIPLWVARSLAAREREVQVRAWEAQENGMYEYNVSHSRRNAWRTANPRPQRLAVPQLAIDTTLAGTCQQALTDLMVPPITYAVVEGAFSLYVDAVEEAVGPCSYAPREMQPMDVDRLWETFATITPING